MVRIALRTAGWLLLDMWCACAVVGPPLGLPACLSVLFPKPEARGWRRVSRGTDRAEQDSRKMMGWDGMGDAHVAACLPAWMDGCECGPTAFMDMVCCGVMCHGADGCLSVCSMGCVGSGGHTTHGVETKGIERAAKRTRMRDSGKAKFDPHNVHRSTTGIHTSTHAMACQGTHTTAAHRISTTTHPYASSTSYTHNTQHTTHALSPSTNMYNPPHPPPWLV